MLKGQSAPAGRQPRTAPQRECWETREGTSKVNPKEGGQNPLTEAPFVQAEGASSREAVLRSRVFPGWSRPPLAAPKENSDDPETMITGTPCSWIRAIKP